MSVYQIMYMDSVPDPAACNEAVKLARKRGFSGLSGFVNGVLRSVARGYKEVEFPTLSVRYGVPEWIIEMWQRDYGEDKTLEILEGLTRETPLTIRTNLSKCKPEELKAALEEDGVKVRSLKELPYAFAISGYDYLAGLKSFRDGLFYVQDLSSMMVAEAASPKEGDTVIDVCAAPGGKSTHIAEKMKGTGMVEARDLTDTKVALIEENIKRNGLKNMRAVKMDATVYDPDSHEKADILICDLPCSGLGVMARKTDIRHKIMQDKLQDVVVLQQNILTQVLDYVKPGGTVIYSTCTVNKAENEEMVRFILKTHPEFDLLSEKQIFPGENGSDGFFLAKIIRKTGN
jgi:16S rRNA (cytosine967-C5)-methyltransferase